MNWPDLLMGALVGASVAFAYRERTTGNALARIEAQISELMRWKDRIEAKE